MLNKNLLKALGLSVALLSPAAQAMSLDWSGGYRFEWTEVDRPSLGTPTERKAYGTNYLYLSPKVIAADGVNVVSRFDILNSQAYPNSQLGDIWGLNNNGVAPGGNAANSSNQGSTDVRVSQLYLTVNQEYGALIVGRAPFEFGLGMTYSSGKGMFDHWYDTRDMVAYKIVVGDWFFMPSLGRKQSTGFGQGGSVTTMGFQLQYESEENKSLLGIYQETTKGVKEALHYTQGTATSQVESYGGDSVNSNMNIQRTNFVLGRGFDAFDFKFEAGFQTGETGVTTGTKDIGLNGYGLAMEFNVPAKESKWDYRVRLGMATGDDSSNDFGGYAFNRNYDVAMLLFNHRLGQKDFLNTNVVKDGAMGIGNSADDESISNTFYFAPSVNYVWSERIDLRNTLVYAQLMQTQNSSVDSSKDLGLEWDIDVVYKHSDRIQWVNQVGLLFPGEAWKNGNDNLDKGFTFGFASKAAISF